MTATSTISAPDSYDSSTATLIENPSILVLLRSVWICVLIFQIGFAIYLFGLSLTPVAYNPATVAELEKLGLVQVFIVVVAMIGLLNSIISCGLSTILMWRSGNKRVSVMFSFILLLLITFTYTTQANTIWFPLPRIRMFSTIMAFLALVYLFPDGRFVPRWMQYIFITTTLVVFINNIQSLVYTNFTSFILLTAMLISLGALVYRYRMAALLQRQQLKWLILIFLLLIFIGTFYPVTYYLIPNSSIQSLLLGILNVLGTLSSFSVAVAVGFAILRYRLWDVDLVINRSLVYGVLSILLVLLFGGVIALVSAVIPEQGQILGVVLATVVATVAFNPARKTIQNVVDRRIYRLNFDLNELGAAQKQAQILNPGVLSGKNLDGYEVRDVLGQGGMGEVYMGYGNGKTIAIKTMLPKIAADANMRSRFQREAQAGMQLDHPHIAKVYAQGEIDGTPYLVMDYIEGQDLSQLIKNGSKLDEETATRLTQDICEALDAAHSKGFIHRDLKPSNIMIRPNGQAVLMDFGVTKKTDASTSLTGTGAIGTIDYMAPEQIMSAKEVDKRADIYALGVMMYEMLTGEKPFKGSAAQILFAHLQQPVSNPLDINPGIPPNIAQAIERAMSKKPEERFQSAGEFAAALTA